MIRHRIVPFAVPHQAAANAVSYAPSPRPQKVSRTLGQPASPPIQSSTTSLALIVYSRIDADLVHI